MSGEEEIEDWVEDNYDPSYFEGLDIEQIYKEISQRFEDDGRAPLDYILRDEKPQFLRFLSEYFNVKPKKTRKPTQAQIVYQFLEYNEDSTWTPKEISELTKLPAPSVRRILQELVRQELIGRIRKGLYRF